MNNKQQKLVFIILSGIIFPLFTIWVIKTLEPFDKYLINNFKKSPKVIYYQGKEPKAFIEQNDSNYYVNRVTATNGEFLVIMYSKY